MPIGSAAYAKGLLPERGWRALRDGVVLLMDQLQMDVEALVQGEEFQNTIAFDYLPDKYLLSYDVGFLRQLAVCVTVVGWKLFDPAHEHRLACLAEELALNAIIRRAEVALEEREEEPVDFSMLEGIAFDDMDFTTLFDPSLDGIEDTPSGKYLRMTNLKFSEWFRPFNPERDAVHPYIEPDEE